MKKVQVALGSRSYPIWIDGGLLEKIGSRLSRLGLGSKCAVITDRQVGPLYAQRVVDAIRQSGIEASLIELPAGEKTKSIQWVGKCYDQLAASRLDRKSFIVALGGGVVGDIAGFIAATYLRGIDFVQIPTTLLAQVDSSVGGKVGVNLKAGKNLVGAFHQPRAVFCDLDVLSTLPDRELKAGLAEVIKYGIIWDPKFFNWIEKAAPDLLNKQEQALSRAIARSCAIKAEVVALDERETTGARALLNFGHTLGHGLEAISGYGKYLHGEAISIGQVAAAWLSMKHAGMAESDVIRIKKLFSQMGLPTTWTGSESGMQNLLSAMSLDKKNVSGEIRFVLSPAIGQATAGHALTEVSIREAIAALGSI